MSRFVIKNEAGASMMEGEYVPRGTKIGTWGRFGTGFVSESGFWHDILMGAHVDPHGVDLKILKIFNNPTRHVTTFSKLDPADDFNPRYPSNRSSLMIWHGDTGLEPTPGSSKPLHISLFWLGPVLSLPEAGYTISISR